MSTILDVPKAANRAQSFTACIDYESVSGTTETPKLLLRNPSSSGVTLMVTHLTFGIDSTVTRSFFKTYIKPTVTSAGTAISENNCRAMTSPPVAVATAFKDPTISANGTLIASRLMQANSMSQGQCRHITIDEGHDLLVTVKNNVASINTFIQVYWVEV